MELALAGPVAVKLWRLGRVARHEADLIADAQDEDDLIHAHEEAHRRHGDFGSPGRADIPNLGISRGRAALRAVHGEAVVAEEVSGYDVADEIQMTHRGMMIAIPGGEWAVFHDLTPVELADVLVRLARSVSLPKFRKHPRGPKEPKTQEAERGQDQTRRHREGPKKPVKRVRDDDSEGLGKPILPSRPERLPSDRLRRFRGTIRHNYVFSNNLYQSRKLLRFYCRGRAWVTPGRE